MNFKRNFYLLIVVAAMFSHSVNAQPKIKIRLIQPPPDNLNINSMWNLSLENTTRSDLKIYLNGNVTEEKDGLIIEGKSKVFTIKPGKTNYKYSDFSGAEVKYNNGKYKEVILRTGNAPEGSYTICVTAFEENGEIAGMENCIMQTVQQLGSITLISPEDGAELNPEQPLIFTWTPLPKGGPYSLRIVELKGDQSPDVAMQTNRPVFEKADISLTTTQVSYSSIHDPGITILEMKYAWQVTSGDVESEVHTIINKGNSDTTSRATDEPVWENFGAQVRCERLGVTFQAAKKIDVNLYHLFAEFTDIVYYQTTEFVNNHPLPEPNIISYEQLFPDVSDPRLFCDEDGRTISRLNGIWKVTEQNTRNGGYVDLGSTPPVNFSLFTLVNLWNYHHPDNLGNSCRCRLTGGWTSGWEGGSQWIDSMLTAEVNRPPEVDTASTHGDSSSGSFWHPDIIVYNSESIIAISGKDRNGNVRVYIDESKLLKVSKNHRESLKMTTEEYINEIRKYLETGQMNPKINGTFCIDEVVYCNNPNHPQGCGWLKRKCYGPGAPDYPNR